MLKLKTMLNIPELVELLKDKKKLKLNQNMKKKVLYIIKKQ